MSESQTFDSTWTVDGSGSWSDAGNWATQVPYYANGQQQITIEPVVPGADDAVSLNPGGTTPFTVTFDTTDEVNSLGSNAYATLAVTGGALTIDQGGLMDGAVTITAGSVTDLNGWNVQGGFSLSAGATVDIAASELAISTGTIAGAISGGGRLYLFGGDQFTLATHVKITTGTLELGVNGDGDGSLTTLDTNVTYTGLFLLDNYSGDDAVLALNGHDMTIAGSSSLDAEITGPGTFTVKGQSAIADGGYSLLSVENGAVLVDAGKITQYQDVDLNNLLIVDKGDSWNIVEDSQIANSGSATIQNAGLFEKTDSTGTSFINANITNTGTILAKTGTLRFDGTLANTGLLSGGTILITGATTTSGTVDVTLLTLQGGGTIGGVLTGTGELDLTNGAAYAIAAGTVLNPGTFGIFGDATQVTVQSKETITGALNLQGGTLDLQSFGVTLLGAATLNGGAAGGSGTLTVGVATIGGNFVMFGTSTLVDAGTITQTGGAQLGGGSTDTVTLTVGARDTYDIAGAYWLGNPNGNDTGLQTIDSAGLFEMTGASGYASIFNTDFTSSGTVLVTAGGRLALDGPQATLSGTIAGAGALYLGTEWTLGPKESVTVSSLENNGSGTLEAASTTYAHAFTNDSGGTVDLNGNKLALTGSATLAGDIGGSGASTLTLAKAALSGFVMYGGATLIDTGTVSQNGYVQLGGGSTDTVTLVVQSHATYDITSAQWLGNPNINDTGTATIDNAGLFEMTGTGTADVWHADFTNTGTLLSDSTLALEGQSASLGGTLTGPGGLVLGTTWTLDPGVVVNVAALENGGAGNLTGSFAYAGTFTNDGGATIDLHGHALSLAGPATLGGAVGDGGTLTLSDAAISGLVVYGAATLIDSGTINQTGGSIDLGGGASDTVTLAVRAGATYDVTVGAWIGNPNGNVTGTSTITNAGLFESTGASSVDVWHSVVTSTGTLLSDGYLALIGPTATLSGVLAGTGDIDLQTTWTLAGGATVTVATLENQGAGGISGNVIVQGAFADDGGSTLALGTHAMTLKGEATLDGSIGGTGSLVLSGDQATTDGSTSITAATVQMVGAATLTLGANLSYGGSFIDNAGALSNVVDAGGNTLVLAGISTLTATKGADVLGGGTVDVTGSLTQSGAVTLGDATGAVTLATGAAGVWDITGDVGMAGTGSSVANAGLFEKTGGTGLSVIQSPFVNTGTVEVTSGTIEFTGGFSGSGTVIGTLTISGGNTFITAAHV